MNRFVLVLVLLLEAKPRGRGRGRGRGRERRRGRKGGSWKPWRCWPAMNLRDNIYRVWLGLKWNALSALWPRPFEYPARWAGFASLSQTLSKPWSKNARSDKGCDKGCRQSFQLLRLLQQPL